MFIKRVLFVSVLCLTMPILTKEEKKERELPLTSESLKSADGLSGLMDKHKVEQTVWLIHEIKQIHSGVYRVNDDGQLDPSNGKIVKEFTFRGKKQTVKSLMDIEAQAKSLSEGERKELSDIFNTLKAYFDKVNIVLAPEAAGTHPFMRPLTEEFCRKHNRPDSILLDWNKGDEIELFRRSVTSFKIFYIFSTDLENFLRDLIKSSPKAWNAYKKALKDAPAPAIKA